jgi:hypothetical protein
MGKSMEVCESGPLRRSRGVQMQLDPVQFDALLAAIRGGAPTFTLGNLIAVIATVIALASLLSSYVLFRYQRAVERRRYVAQLHETWWSEDLDTKRHIVWQELEKWQKLGPDSPALRYYAKQGETWPIDAPERRAHARVLFFFSDLNRLIAHRLIEEDIAFEMFGVAQYEWFREYIGAIREAVKNREPDPHKTPRWVAETEEFEQRLDAWKRRMKIA